MSAAPIKSNITGASSQAESLSSEVDINLNETLSPMHGKDEDNKETEEKVIQPPLQDVVKLAVLSSVIDSRQKADGAIDTTNALVTPDDSAELKSALLDAISTEIVRFLSSQAKQSPDAITKMTGNESFMAVDPTTNGTQVANNISRLGQTPEQNKRDIEEESSGKKKPDLPAATFDSTVIPSLKEAITPSPQSIPRESDQAPQNSSSIIDKLPDAHPDNPDTDSILIEKIKSALLAAISTKIAGSLNSTSNSKNSEEDEITFDEIHDGNEAVQGFNPNIPETTSGKTGLPKPEIASDGYENVLDGKGTEDDKVAYALGDAINLDHFGNYNVRPFATPAPVAPALNNTAIANTPPPSP